MAGAVVDDLGQRACSRTALAHQRVDPRPRDGVERRVGGGEDARDRDEEHRDDEQRNDHADLSARISGSPARARRRIRRRRDLAPRVHLSCPRGRPCPARPSRCGAAPRGRRPRRGSGATA